MPFIWSESLARYRDSETGRIISQARLREGADATVSLSAQRLGDLAAQLRVESITVERFQADLYAHIKDVHVANALAAYGGRSQMDPSRWGYVGARIRSEYAYARTMVSQVIDGSQPLNSRFEARVRQYAQAGRVTFEAVQAREARGRGQTDERNVLHAAESCRECRSLAALGWVALGTLPMIGARQCGQNCRCTISRRSRQEAEAA